MRSSEAARSLEVTQHATLSTERWSAFTLDQQILMIANELNRGAKLMDPQDRERLGSAYERVLALVDLTIRVHQKSGLRRELLRWRDLVARLYVLPGSDPEGHTEAFRCLLRFTPGASQQLPFVTLPGRTA
jgi:hypothetical protein